MICSIMVDFWGGGRVGGWSWRGGCWGDGDLGFVAGVVAAFFVAAGFRHIVPYDGLKIRTEISRWGRSDFMMDPKSENERN